MEGQLVEEDWRVRGCGHREDGPALREWDFYGRLLREVWYLHGQLHREGGPARQEWDSQGRRVVAACYIFGKPCGDAEARQDHH
jgi:hypothetical protein